MKQRRQQIQLIAPWKVLIYNLVLMTSNFADFAELEILINIDMFMFCQQIMHT